MRLILNVIWLIFGGLWLALGYLLAALICFLLIVTIPFGFAALRIASYALWPFGRTIVDKPGAGTGALIGNVIWMLLFGIWLAIGHLVSAVAMAVTIIGIPLALANLKLIPVSLMPLGKEIVPRRRDRANRFAPRAARDDADRSWACLVGASGPETRDRRRGVPGRWPVARHLRPGRHRPAGVADRSLQPAVHLLHARRRPGLAARRAAAAARRAGPAAAHRGHPAGHHQRALHRR